VFAKHLRDLLSGLVELVVVNIYLTFVTHVSEFDGTVSSSSQLDVYLFVRLDVDCLGGVSDVNCS